MSTYLERYLSNATPPEEVLELADAAERVERPRNLLPLRGLEGGHYAAQMLDRLAARGWRLERHTCGQSCEVLRGFGVGAICQLPRGHDGLHQSQYVPDPNRLSPAFRAEWGAK